MRTKKFIMNSRWDRSRFEVTAYVIVFCALAAGQLHAQAEKTSTPSHIFPAGFEGVTPGKTTTNELPALLGQTQQRIDGGKELVFRVASFEEVRTRMKAGVVQEVIVTLRVPSATSWAKGFLGAEKLKHVDVIRGGEALRVIPERGIYLVRASKTSDDVTHIRIGMPVAKDLVERAQDQRRHGYMQTWSDLSAALAMSNDDNIRIELAELALNVERYDQVKKFLDGVPQAKRNAKWKLLFARWVAAIGARKDAIAALQHAVDDPKSPPSVRMTALVERAKVELASNTGDPSQAAQWLQRATDEAMKALAQDPLDITAAKVLFDAHLAMMRSIATGDWSRQHASLDQWQTGAEQLVPHVTLDGANICAKQDLVATIIASRTQLEEAFEHRSLVRQLEQVTTTLVGKGDALLAQRARRGAADALTQVAMRQLKDGDYRAATATFEAALAALTNGAKTADMEKANLRKLVDVLFARGVVDSVGSGDHEAASLWFRRMLSALEDPRVKPYPREAIIRGDQLVSIGVSFWQIGAKEAAIDVTERGLQYIDSAIDVGWGNPTDRVVAVDNLKAMHAASGHKEKAEFYEAQRRNTKAQR